MMIIRPLNQYKLQFKGKFREVAEATFEELSKESNVDIRANRALCEEITELQDEAGKVRKRLNLTRFLCVLLWCFVAVVIIAFFCFHPQVDVIIFLAIAAIVSVIALFTNVHPAIKRLKEKRNELIKTIDDKTKEAWAQMEPLNRLYDWDVLYRMFSEVIPQIVFDDYVPTARLAQLQSHGFATYRNHNSSILYVHSGTINGNPFILYRERKFQWGTKTYTGTKTIHWTTSERGSDGKYVTRHHSQVLTASIVKPYPEFPECTRLVYGHAAAPNLAFSREKNMFNYKEGGMLYGLKKKWLERKSRKMSSDYAMHSNDEFEVLFTATNRTDNQQFFLLFTPLAQQGMIELLQDKEDGYGDNFTFAKSGKINQVVADHVQSIDLDLNPQLFHNYNYDDAKDRFITHNCALFRAIYFTLSPILSIPLYQDAPDGYTGRMTSKSDNDSSVWEHESLANFWGEAQFSHPSCATSSILKTQIDTSTDGAKTISVTAHGFGATPRITYIKKYGGDGKWHNVPVNWVEYYPVTGEGSFCMKEMPREAIPEMPSERYKTKRQMIDNFRYGAIIRRNILSSLD